MLSRHFFQRHFKNTNITKTKRFLSNLLFKDMFSGEAANEGCDNLRPVAPFQPFFGLNNSNDYQKIHSEIVDAIKLKTNTYLDYVPSKLINPLPILVSKSQLDEYKAIQEALYYSIQTIVSNYFNDERIRDVFNFPDKVKKVLELYRDKPYDRVGSFRPDLVHEKNSCVPKICEINARFTANGYFMTYYGCEALKDVSSLNWLRENHECQDIQYIKQIAAAFLDEFESNKPVVILRNRESNKDMKGVNELLKNSIQLTTDEIYLNTETNKLHARTAPDRDFEVDQFILELHQDELLSMPFEVLKCMVNNCAILNDLRTIFLVHDKRFLTILNDDELLGEYSSEQYHRVIKTHRIDSLLPKKLSQNKTLHHKVVNNKDDWLIKPCLFGKGEGIVFGKNVSSDEWNNLIDSCINSQNFIIQNYINQEKFDVFFDYSLQKYNLVGTILCFNDLFLGPGIFRGSQKDLIALTQGGFIVYPLKGHLKQQNHHEEKISQKNDTKLKITKSNNVKLVDLSLGKKADYENHVPFSVPEAAIFHLDKMSFKHVDSYLNCLIEHGFVLIKPNFKDNQSTFFLSLIRHLGAPFIHSAKGNDFVWHIKPSFIPNGVARSHTKNVFQMHTDASFENIPPRFFGLQVIKADKFDGGKSLLLDVDELVSALQPEDVEVLKNRSFNFKIPAEFQKNDREKVTQGRILGVDLLDNFICRYRYDLILDRDNLDEDEERALRNFERLIDLRQSKLIKYFTMEENSILLVDNCRFLHGRTEIKDLDRHLTRVRFQTLHRQLLPRF